jgi:uncharacterized iron-regulated protein
MRVLLVSIYLILFASLSHAQSTATTTPTHPLLEKIVNAQGTLLTQAEVFNQVKQHRYVLVGEKHDNPEHHRVESLIIRARLDQDIKLRGTVVFEMLDDGQNTALAGLHSSDSLEQMYEKLAWPKKGWDWSSYGPLFQLALQSNALRAGNISKPFIGQLYKEGEQAISDQARYGTVFPSSKKVKDHLLDQIFLSHCGMQSRETLNPMLTIQLAKDASMAYAMRMGAPSILIAGGEHVRPETAVPSHIRQQEASADIFVIQLLEARPGENDINAYIKAAGAADVYWFTSATATKDYCADVRGKAAQ